MPTNPRTTKSVMNWPRKKFFMFQEQDFGIISATGQMQQPPAKSRFGTTNLLINHHADQDPELLYTPRSQPFIALDSLFLLYSKSLGKFLSHRSYSFLSTFYICVLSCFILSLLEFDLLKLPQFFLYLITASCIKASKLSQ